MPKNLQLQVDIQLKVAKEVPSSSLAGHYVFASPASSPGQVLGSARTDETGKGQLKLVFAGERPPALVLTLSPLPTRKAVQRVRNETLTIQQWKGDATKGYAAAAAFSPSREFLDGVDWLHERFTVEGVLVSQYTEAETGIVREYPISGARVGLYEVDKEQLRVCKPATPCLPRCKPFDPYCIPDISCTPSVLCRPVLEPFCGPKFEEICTPSVIIKGCGPWRFDGGCSPGRVTIPGDFGDVIDPIAVRPAGLLAKTTAAVEAAATDASASTMKSGCCGSEIRPAAAYRSGPLSSPAVAGSALASCLPAQVVCLPHYMPPLVRYTESPLGGGEYVTGADGRFWFTFTRLDFFSAPAGTTHTEDFDWDEFPDLAFQARLWYDGADHVIYSEKPQNARWNIHLNYTFWKLVVQGQVPGAGNPDDIDPGQTEAFLFHTVGDIEPGWIDGQGVINSPPAGHWSQGHVFGGTLEIRGQFASSYSDNNHYYQVEWRRGDSGDFTPVTGEAWYYSHYDSATGHWTTLTRAPQNLGGDFVACYPIPDYTDITIDRKDMVLVWSTWRADGNIPRYPDGKYQLRVRLIRQNGSTYEAEPGFNPDDRILTLTIDNTWPSADIDGTLQVATISPAGVLSDLGDVETCGFVNAGTSRYLILPFTLADTLGGKLCQYAFEVNRGSDQAKYMVAVPTSWTQGPGAISVDGVPLMQPAQSYADAASAPSYLRGCAAFKLFDDLWLGTSALKPCAYNFSLWVYDRATNGYGHIHWREVRATLTILAPGVVMP
jgi:hypothetical protein